MFFLVSKFSLSVLEPKAKNLQMTEILQNHPNVQNVTSKKLQWYSNDIKPKIT